MADEQKEEITGPSGPKSALDLRTKPHLGVGLKRELVVGAITLSSFVVAGVMYSLYHKGEVQQQAQTQADAEKVSPAGQEGATALKRQLDEQSGGKQEGSGGITGPSTLNPPAAAAGNTSAPPVVLRAKNGQTVQLPPNAVQNGVAGGAQQPPPQHVPTPEEVFRAKQQEAYSAALVADTAASSGHGSGSSFSSGSNSQTQSPTQMLTAAVNRAADRLAGNQQASATTTPPAAASGFGASSDPNRQDQKEAFQFHSTIGADTLTSTREAALTRYEIRAGWDIPATLEGGLNSDLPGSATAIVRESVYDTATGGYLLIPQGSRLVGVYNSQVTYGQGRVQIVWSRLVYPDGTAVSLGNMPGVDAAGVTGFHDQTNNHFGRLFSEAMLSSAFAAGIGLSQKQNTNAFSTPTNGQLISGAVGQQLGQVGSEITHRNLDIQPTIVVRPGYRFNVRVTKDIVFEQPYTPLYQ